MNPFQRLGVKISNWWRGEPQDSGGVVTLNSPSFLEKIGLKRKGKPTSEVTYFTCLKMLSETLAKMPIKYYQKTDKGIIEAEATDASKLPPRSDRSARLLQIILFPSHAPEQHPR